METKQLTVTVPKEISEVGECLGNILKITGQQLKDGWQTSQDLPAVLGAAFGGLMSAIENCQKIPEEFKEDPFMASTGMLVPVMLGAREMLSNLKKN